MVSGRMHIPIDTFRQKHDLYRISLEKEDKKTILLSAKDTRDLVVSGGISLPFETNTTYLYKEE